MSKNYLFVFIFLFVGCSILKKTTYEYNYNGKIEIIKDDENRSFKVNLKFDSLNNADIKVFAFAGLKIGDFIITDNTIEVKYIIDKDYKNSVISQFEELNKKICLKKLIFDLATNKNEIIKNTGTCYKVVKGSDKNSYFLLDNFSEKVLEISKIKILSRGKKKIYTFRLPDSVVNLELLVK